MSTADNNQDDPCIRMAVVIDEVDGEQEVAFSAAAPEATDERIAEELVSILLVTAGMRSDGLEQAVRKKMSKEGL